MVIQTGWRHEASWPGLPASVPLARDFVLHALEEHRLPVVAQPARLVTSELATNSVLHAHTAFEVSLELVDGYVELNVHDGSPDLPRTATADLVGAGGRGLVLVAALSSAWGVRAENGGKRVWARFRTAEP